MSRFQFLVGAVAVTVALASDATAAGRHRVRGECACGTPVPVVATPCCGGTNPVQGVTPGTVVPAPAAGGQQLQHSSAPTTTEIATAADATKKAGCCGAGAACCAQEKASALVYADGAKPAEQADAKEVKLEGTLVCAKCGLKEAGVKKCTNALQVKEGEKTVTYYFEDKGNGEGYHEGVCGGGKKEGTKVTGTVTEKDGKKWVKATKVEEKK